MKKIQKKQISKILIAVCVTSVLLFLTIRFLLPLCKLLATENGREEICMKVESYGFWAPFIFILLMATQIVVAFIPGGPLEMIAGMMFGGIWGTVWTVCGVLAGTCLVYLLVKRFGRPLVGYFVSEDKMQHFAILQDEDKLEILVFFLFLIPGIPKDLLTYVVPLTKMPGSRFFLLSTIARFPAIVASVLVGDSLAEQNYRLCILIAVLSVAFIFAGFLIKKHIYRKRENKL